MRAPPRIPHRLLRRAAPPGPRGASMVGDLHEEWEERVARGAWSARVWYWGAVTLLVSELVWGRVLRVAGGSRRWRMSHRVEQIAADVRLSVRNLARRPLFSLVAIGSLIVGIGANTAIYSVVNRLFIQPVPGIPDQDRIVELGRTRDGEGFDTFTYPDFEDLRAETSVFQEVAGWIPGNMSFSGPGEGGVRLTTLHVSANYFTVLGVVPERGRFFVPEEDEGVGEHPVAVLSHRFWSDALGGDPDVIGRTILLNREAYTVVGIAPPDFRSHMVGFRADAWLPLMQLAEVQERPAQLDNRNSSWFMALGRLTPGTTLPQADAAARAVFGRLASEYPDTNARRSARAIPLGPIPGPGRPGARMFVVALAALVALVLLVTCANVAGMLLARGAARSREIAVRSALGSTRGRLVRFLATEAVLLFVCGGLGGFLVARWLMSRVTLESLPTPFTLELDLAPDAGVLGFALVVTALTGLVFGTLPGIQASRPNLVASMKADGSDRAGRSFRLRRFFVAGQVGLSLVLLAAAGLFLRSLQQAGRIGGGFDPSDVVVTTVDLSMEGYETEQQGRGFQAQVVERLGALPGVEGVAFSGDLPLDLGRSGTAVILEHHDPDDPRGFLGVDFNTVTDDYFSVLRIPVLQGRTFGPQDTPESMLVAVVSRTFAEQAWPGEAALGRSFVFGGRGGRSHSVVGVVEDTKNQTVSDEPTPFVYASMQQRYDASGVLTVRRPGPLPDVAPMLRAAILEVDPALSLTPFVTLDRYTGVGMLPQRVAATITSGLGLLALLLSGLGIYGVVAFIVVQQTREIGLRMALGAGRRRVVGSVVRRALGMSLPGILIGGLAALALGPLVGSLLIGVSPLDLVALVGVALLLLVVVLLASFAPARRASRILPMDALRQD